MRTTTTATATEPITFAEWRRRACSLKERADRLTRQITDDARRTCRAAGLDPTLLGIHPHNAMCALEYGRPWPEVNYSLCRRTLYLIDRSYEPHRIADRINARLWARVQETR